MRFTFASTMMNMMMCMQGRMCMRMRAQIPASCSMAG